MGHPSTTRGFSNPTMGQLMGCVAALAAIFALLATVQSLGDGTTFDFRLLAAAIVGYTFYLVYLVWLSFAYFTRSQVLILLTATAVLATIALQVVMAMSGWIGLAAVLTLPFMPFVLGALMLWYGGHWVPEPELGDSGALGLLVKSKRGRGLTPQAEGPPPDLEPEKPPRPNMGARKTAAILVAVVVGLALAVGAGRYLLRRHYLMDLAAQHGQEEDRCFLEGQKIEEGLDEMLEKDPDSPELQKYVQERKLRAEQWYKLSDWHGNRRRAYEERWW